MFQIRQSFYGHKKKAASVLLAKGGMLSHPIVTQLCRGSRAMRLQMLSHLYGETLSNLHGNAVSPECFISFQFRSASFCQLTPKKKSLTLTRMLSLNQWEVVSLERQWKYPLQGNVSQLQGNAFMPLKECCFHCHPGECCLNGRGVVSSPREFHFPSSRGMSLHLQENIVSSCLCSLFPSEKYTEREKKRKTCPS